MVSIHFNYLILILVLFSCKTLNQKKIESTCCNINNPIILKYNTKYNKITRLYIPFEIELKNKTLENDYFSSVIYKYASNEGSLGVSIFKKNEDNKLKRLKMASKKVIPAVSSNKIIVYSRHKIDTSEVMQSHFKDYISKLDVKNDSITIQNTTNFKNKHISLLKSITNKDTIILNMWGSDNDRNFGSKLRIPVKF